jgi:hypothetical protein
MNLKELEENYNEIMDEVFLKKNEEFNLVN